MRPRSIVYPVILLYELVRLAILSSSGTGLDALPASWYAGLALLVLVPILVFMLLLDEERFTAWLPLISLAKALGIPALTVYIARNISTAFSFALAGDTDLFKTILLVVLIMLADIVVGIFCFRRNAKLCK